MTNPSPKPAKGKTGRFAPFALCLLLGLAVMPARADVLPVWWSSKIAPQGFDALEDRLYASLDKPLVLQAAPFDGSRSEVAEDCPAAVDAFERGFYQADNAEQLIICRARIAAYRAAEPTRSTFRGVDGKPAAMTPQDLLLLPSLVGPYKGCAELMVSLRSDQNWWSLARHHHVYFGPETDGATDDGREAQFIKPSKAGIDKSAHPYDMQAAPLPHGGLLLRFGTRVGEIEPLVWGDFDGNGLEDMLVRVAPAGGAERLVAITRPKPGTVMTLLDPKFHYVKILDACPALALQQMTEGCIE